LWLPFGPQELLLLVQHDIKQTLQIAQDVLQVTIDQHHIEEVPDQEWVDAMKVSISAGLQVWIH